MGIIDSYIPDTSAPYYTQDYVPIKSMYGGVIQTKDNRFIRIIEVIPVNFESKNSQERDDIINEFRGWLAIAPINIQIKIMTENSDPQKAANKVLERVRNSGDVNVERHCKYYVNMLNNIKNSGAVLRRFFLIVSYEQKSGSKKNLSDIEIAEELNEMVASISTYFTRMDNLIVPLSESGEPEDEKLAVMEMLYKLYNPRTSVNEPNKPAVTLQDRIERVFQDKKIITNNPNASVELADVIAPLSIDVKHKDYVMYDGMYYTYLLVSGDSYPIETYAGWFINSFSFGPGENVDIFIHKEDRNQFLKKISTNIRMTTVKLEEKNKTQADYEKTERALDSAQYIKKVINQNGEDPFFIATLITLSGYTYEDLIKRKEQVIDFFTAKDIILDPLNNIQEESMRSSLPFLDLSPKLYERGKRNVMASGLSSCYPFISANMNDDNGILLGQGITNKSVLIMNMYNKKIYPNANMVILGGTGMGKTYLEQTMALRIRTAMGAQCFILAPYKGHEFQRACTAGIDGEFVKIAASSKSSINIMDVHPAVSEDMMLLMGESANSTSWVSEQAGAIITFISLLSNNLSEDEEQIIDTSIMRTYAKYGITEDNDSIYLDPRNKGKGLKEMPIIEDLYNELEQTEISDKVLRLLSQFITGSAKSFNRRTNVDLSNKYIVFDISDLRANLLPAGMFVILNTIVNKIKEDVTEKKMVFIDEVWRLIGSGANEKAAEYVKWLVKIIRAYNGGVCTTTQDIGDFFALNDGEYGKAILANSSMKMLLGMKGTDLEIVQREVNLTTSERRALQQFERGECLICANNNHIQAKIEASPFEHKLITTDPDEVKLILAEMKQNGGKIA